MGGRFALVTLESFASLIEKIYLLAPDGLVKNKWYQFATSFTILRSIFHFFMNSPKLLFMLTSSAGKIGVLNKGLLKFVQVHLKYKTERIKIYNTWTSFRKLHVAPNNFIAILELHNIEAKLVLGEFDRVINAKKFKKALKKSENLEFQIVPLTHNKLFYYNFS